MDVQVAARVAIRAIVELIRVEGGMNRLRRARHVCHERVALLVGEVDDLADVILVRDDAASGVALLLEENQRADVQLADDDAERIEQLAARAIAAIRVFHGENLLSFFADLIIYAAVHISNGKVNQKEDSLSEVLFV